MDPKILILFRRTPKKGTPHVGKPSYGGFLPVWRVWYRDGSIPGVGLSGPPQLLKAPVFLREF